MSTLTIPERIDRLENAAETLREFYLRSDVNDALYELLVAEAAVWETAYDFVVDNPGLSDGLFEEPSVVTFDALAEAILAPFRIN